MPEIDNNEATRAARNARKPRERRTGRLQQRLWRSCLHGRWLIVAACIYSALWALELARVALYEQPAVYHAGLYPRELGPPRMGAVGDSAFRWTGDLAHLVRPVGGSVMSLPLYAARPDIPETAASVSIFVNDRVLDRVDLRDNGWHEAAYYLPPLREAGAAIASPSPVELRIEPSTTFVPSRIRV